MIRRPIALTLLFAASAGSASAQTMRDRVTNLFRFGGGCDQPVCLSVGSGHGDHYNPAVVEGSLNLIAFLTNAIGVSASSIPISAASSGSIWGTDAGGFPVRTRTSAGPIFAERSATIGKKRFLIGANASGFEYTTLRGVPLDGLVLSFTHQDNAPDGLGDPDFESDVIQVDARVKVRLIALTTFLTYGLTDRVDLSVAVPLLRSSMDGSTVAQVIPFANPTPHFFGDGTVPLLRATAASRGSATGLGDIAVRLKANLVKGARTGFSLLADTRLGTGREEDFLGSGNTTFRGLGILSLRYGAFSPHANLGYHYRGSDQNGAVLATLGFDHLMGPSFTLAVDMLSEWQVGDTKLAFPDPVTVNALVGSSTSVRIVSPINVPDRRDNRVLTSLGAKFTSAGGMSVVTNILVPVLRGGLQPNLAWTAGLEYSF